MASLVENFVRRIEKIVSTRSTVPIPGTDHVNSDWLDTDIYPGELSVQFSNGKLYTTDGMNIIELNRENLILYGLELKKRYFWCQQAKCYFWTSSYQRRYLLSRFIWYRCLRYA